MPFVINETVLNLFGRWCDLIQIKQVRTSLEIIKYVEIQAICKMIPFDMYETSLILSEIIWTSLNLSESISDSKCYLRQTCLDI